MLGDELRQRVKQLERTLADWGRCDLEQAARAALIYLPSQARIHTRIFPVIKPETNSFVFGGTADPMIFLYVDPTCSPEQFENTVRHELHHIGYESAAGTEGGLEGLSAGARMAASWMGAFGEGMAMLAAAGGPEVHPHACSAAEERARWDRDTANLGQDLRRVEAFFLDIIDGRLTGDDPIRRKASSFFGVQGPWYTVGWKMASMVEACCGRATLIECMLEPRHLLATYNRAATARESREELPQWSQRLLQEVGARSLC